MTTALRSIRAVDRRATPMLDELEGLVEGLVRQSQEDGHIE
jgi:hypothetical protein